MSLYRRTYEPIRIIIDSGSHPDLVGRLLGKFTIAFLVLNAVLSFALILSIVIVSQFTTAIRACVITYIVVFLVVLTTGSALYVRVLYFKTHPPRSPPPAHSQMNADVYYGEEGHRPSININRKGADQESDFEIVDVRGAEERHYQVPPYDHTQYLSPSSEASNQYANDTKTERLEDSESAVSMMDGALSEIARGSLPDRRREESEIPPDYSVTNPKRKRFSFEPPESSIASQSSNPIPQEMRQYPQHSAGSVNRQASIECVVEDVLQVRKLPFTPSWSQLTGGVRDGSTQYETGEGNRAAGLRANWHKRGG